MFIGMYQKKSFKLDVLLIQASKLLTEKPSTLFESSGGWEQWFRRRFYVRSRLGTANWDEEIKGGKEGGIIFLHPRFACWVHEGGLIALDPPRENARREQRKVDTYFGVQDQNFKGMEYDRELKKMAHMRKIMSTNTTNMRPNKSLTIPRKDSASCRKRKQRQWNDFYAFWVMCCDVARLSDILVAGRGAVRDFYLLPTMVRLDFDYLHFSSRICCWYWFFKM